VPRLREPGHSETDLALFLHIGMEERRRGMFVGGRLKGSMIEAAVRRFSKPRVGGAPADPNPARPRLIRYFNYRPSAGG